MLRCPFPILLAILIISAALFVGVFLGQPKMRFGGSTNSQSVVDHRTKFSDICHCVILAVGRNGSFAVGTQSKREVILPLVAGTGTRNGYFDTRLAPDKRAMAAITDQGRKVQYITSHETTPTVLYSVSGDEKVVSLDWSVDSRSLVIGVQVPADTEPTGGIWPTRFVLVDLVAKKSSTIITRDEVKKLKVRSLLPMAVSGDAKTILFANGGLGAEQYFVWKKSRPTLSPVSTSIAGTVYFSLDNIDNGEILWYLSGELHRVNIDSMKETVQGLPAVTDGPISQVSPDGYRVVYLRRVGSTQTGTLTMHDLNTGAERQLSDTPITSSSGLANAVWTPSGSYLIFPGAPSSPQQYYAIRTDQKQPDQKPDPLQPLAALHDAVIFGLYPSEPIPARIN